MFHLYILQSESSGQLYIGQTNNLMDRLERHNANRNKSTKGKGPWKIIFSKEYPTRAEAVKAERMLKNWKSKVRVLEWIVKPG